MPRFRLAACLLLLPALAGCALADAIFSVFGDSYSAAGPSWGDKARHYDSQVEASQAYAEANRKTSDDASSPWHATALHGD
jgi:hypothetical protein